MHGAYNVKKSLKCYAQKQSYNIHSSTANYNWTLNTNSLRNPISPHSFLKIKVYFKKPKKTVSLMSHNVLNVTH